MASAATAAIPNQADRYPLGKFQPPPVYPLTGTGWGEVVVDFTVDTEGNVRNPIAISSTDIRLEQCAVEAVAKWKFEPGAKDGKLVDWHMRIPIVFNSIEKQESNPIYVEGLKRSALGGDTVSQIELFWHYHDGLSGPKDPFEAEKWIRMAAEQGNDDAEYLLGWTYVNGDAVPKSAAEGAKWFRKAANHGHVKAQVYLGYLYIQGEGVPKDRVEGLAWTNIAAASGVEAWIKNRDYYEGVFGPEVAATAQLRSNEILKELEPAKPPAPSSIAGSTSIPAPPVEEEPKFSGSGAIVSTDGYILTAAHVVAGGKSVKVFTEQGLMAAKVVRIDEANDVAVLKLASGTYPALPIAPSRKIRLGQMVATIGFPNIQIQGFSPKVTRGEISSLNGIGDDPRTWQISVSLQTGNSGGPLLDENGNLVGVVLSKLGLRAAMVTGDLPQNVNYAVKSAYALALLEPYLGTTTPVPSQRAPQPRFEDMVAKAQQSVVLILVY
jgi:TonB family protein